MKLVLISLGKRGGSLHFTRDLMQAARNLPDLQSRLVISDSNEIADQFTAMGTDVLTLPTFSSNKPWAMLTAFLRTRHILLDYLAREKADAVLTVMPHIWTPLLGRDIRKRNIKHAVIVHDARPHPGDATAIVTRWLRSEADKADLVVTLSKSVADVLVSSGIDPTRLLTLYHPDMGVVDRNARLEYSGPLRLLFIGRIQAYKGVATLLDAMTELQNHGVPVTLTLAGQGSVTAFADKIVTTGTRLLQKWLSEAEIAELLATHDAIVLPYQEASQSGVAAVAFANAMPVIALPTGGIAEQVIDGQTGLLASAQTAHALAASIRRLADSPTLFKAIETHLRESKEKRSMQRFLSRIISALRN